MIITPTKPLTLSGRKFSKKELIHIQQTRQSFPSLSRQELAETLCENLHWKTANHKNKHVACLGALEKMEDLGLITLPEKQIQKKHVYKKIRHTQLSDAKPVIDCNLDDLDSLTLQQVTTREDRSLWKEYIDRYHYLAYKHPIGASLMYFITTRNKHDQRQILGCLSISASVWALSDRDTWIGWNKEDRNKRLNLVVNNKRFLILPWVKVTHLASKALSLLANQIQDDWKRIYNYKPVLLETFVDPDKYEGTCYKAANWEHVGKTSGRARTEKGSKTNQKSIFVYPLQSNFKAILKNTKKPGQKKEIDSAFLSLWGKVVTLISVTAQDYDDRWQKRKRVIDSLLLIFLIFRLVFSKNSQSYSTTITEFWHNCHKMKFPLPQKKPISASSFTEARKKLNASIFQTINQKIIEANIQQDQYKWLGHRLFAVDGSKLNLPKPLEKDGYKIPNPDSYYPQGLLSCLYQLKAKIPHDFDRVNHGDERRCALRHLKSISEDDVVVYDRGYFSYAMLYYHIQAGIHPIFRLKRNSSKQIDVFMNGLQVDQTIELMPSKSTQREIKKKYPEIIFQPLSVRLLRYTINGDHYYLGTTLMDKQYSVEALQKVYHARWGIEELYKISKQHLEIDDFHGRSERTVKQELFASFVLITMSRLCSNESERLLARLFNPEATGSKNKDEVRQVNFKNALATLSRHLESIMFVPARHINNTVKEIVLSMSRFHQKPRPGRSYIRRSLTPSNKWRGCKSTI